MSRAPQGKFLGIPYNRSALKPGELKRGVWDPEDPRLFPPKTYGWGYGINFAALLRRVRSR